LAGLALGLPSLNRPKCHSLAKRRSSDVENVMRSSTARNKDQQVDNNEIKRLHDEVGFIGLRAQATAVGLLQLSIELHRAGILDDPAIERVKGAIANDLSLSPPGHQTREEHRLTVKERLDRLFAGNEPLSLKDSHLPL
jgi:hypothetical protein